MHACISLYLIVFCLHLLNTYNYGNMIRSNWSFVIYCMIENRTHKVSQYIICNVHIIHVLCSSCIVVHHIAKGNLHYVYISICFYYFLELYRYTLYKMHIIEKVHRTRVLKTKLFDQIKIRK